jgi:acyl dehydratase
VAVAIDPQVVRQWAFEPVERRYAERDTILYALGLGLGQHPLDSRQLRFVYEKDLIAVPTMSVLLGHPGSWLADPRTGIDYRRVVHGEQHLEILAPLPPAGAVRCVNRVEDMVDKGVGRGALIHVSREIEDMVSSTLVARQRSVLFARGDGGFGGSATSRVDALPASPDRSADDQFVWHTLSNQAILYRLSGDLNPLHIDPEVAQSAGFEGPILHGLSSFGIAGLAAIDAFCDHRPERLRSLDLRFSGPVYPGETLLFDLWRTDEGAGAFRARVQERDTVVLDNGRATWR